MRREHLSCEILLFLWLRVTKVIHFSSFHQKSVQSEGGDARLACTFATWWAQVKCRCFCLAKMAFEWLLWEESASLKKGENELKQQVRECSKLDTAHLKPQDRRGLPWTGHGCRVSWGWAGSFCDLFSQKFYKPEAASFWSPHKARLPWFIEGELTSLRGKSSSRLTLALRV